MLAGAGSGQDARDRGEDRPPDRQWPLSGPAHRRDHLRNKSAKEMRERVRLRGEQAEEVTICTFHALGLKFLQIEHATKWG